MEVIKHINTLIHNGNEYKMIRTQKFDDKTHKSTNQFYLNGKIVHGQKRYEIETRLDEQRNNVSFNEIRSKI